MLGNYAQYNLSAETNWAQFIYNANIGIKLSKKNNLWLDAGLMPSHIGAESAISDDCWSLTRSLSAENSPYYETGIKLNYTSKEIYQFKLKNYVVCENYIYRNREHYDSIICRIDRKEEFKLNANSKIQEELNKIV